MGDPAIEDLAVEEYNRVGWDPAIESGASWGFFPIANNHKASSNRLCLHQETMWDRAGEASKRDRRCHRGGFGSNIAGNIQGETRHPSTPMPSGYFSSSKTIIITGTVAAVKTAVIPDTSSLSS